MSNKIITVGLSKWGNIKQETWTGILQKVFKNKDFEVRTLDTAYSIHLDYLIFDGGEDVTPLLYGQLIEQTTVVNFSRDLFEQQLFRTFFNTETKFIGICRGSQFINVMLYGTLYQDLPSSNLKHKKIHKNKIISETRLSNYIKDEEIMVNSYHHQAVRKLGMYLKPTMFSDNNVIEGYEYIGWDKIRAVQCHPEYLEQDFPHSYRLLEYLFREPTIRQPKTTE